MPLMQRGGWDGPADASLRRATVGTSRVGFLPKPVALMALDPFHLVMMQACVQPKWPPYFCFLVA